MCIRDRLWKAGHDIRAVVTQPDKPKGRGKEVQMSPVKQFAVSHDISVFQPVRIKKPEAVEQLKTYEADVFVVAAFGQILSQEKMSIRDRSSLRSILRKKCGMGDMRM